MFRKSIYFLIIMTSLLRFVWLDIKFTCCPSTSYHLKDIGSVPLHKDQNLTSWFGQGINTAEFHPSDLRRSEIELTKNIWCGQVFHRGAQLLKKQIFFLT